MVVISLTYLNCNNQCFYSFLIQKLYLFSNFIIFQFDLENIFIEKKSQTLNKTSLNL
jgi:hypothetical protein